MLKNLCQTCKSVKLVISKKMVLIRILLDSQLSKSLRISQYLCYYTYMKTPILKQLHFLFLSIFLLILVLSSCNTSPSTQQIMDDMPALFNSNDLANASEVKHNLVLDDLTLGKDSYEEFEDQFSVDSSNLTTRAEVLGTSGYIVYIRRNSTTQQIWTHNLLTDRRTKVYEGPEAIGSVAVSGDGLTIVATIRFRTPLGTNADIYKFRVGGVVQKLTSTTYEERHVSMASTGNIIMWEGQSGDYRQVFYCYLVSNACDLSIRFIENGYNSVEPSISANGVMIVYVRPLNSGMDRLFLVNQASNRSLAITDLENIRYPSVSNNGVIAFGRDNSDGTTDLMLRSNGQVSSLFKSSKPLFHASISPDGQFLTYSYEVNGYRSLFMRDIVNNTEVQLGGGNWDYLAAYWQGKSWF